MSNLIGILGLVFIVILFSFTYPQNALDLLLKTTKYYQAISYKNKPEYEKKLLNVKGWFFLTDLLQFLMTCFIGIFVIFFFFFNYLLNFLPKSYFSFIIIFLVSAVGNSLYVIITLRSVKRISDWDDEKDFMNRKEWLWGKGGKMPFKSKLPISALIFVSITTTSLLMFLTISGTNHYFENNKENSLIVLGAAICIVFLIYLINLWGFFVYMPGSSTADLNYLCEREERIFKKE